MSNIRDLERAWLLGERSSRAASDAPTDGALSCAACGCSRIDVQDDTATASSALCAQIAKRVASTSCISDMALGETITDNYVESGGRGSIFGPQATEQLRKTLPISGDFQEKPMSSFLTLLLQIAVLSSSVFASAMYPIVMEYSLWDADLQAKVMNFNPCVVYAMYYALSSIIGVIMSFFCYGPVGAKRCFLDKDTLIKVIPAGLLLTIAEICDIAIMQRADASSKSVVSQIRLPAVALLSTFILRKKLTAEQWTLLFSVGISSTGFSVANTQAKAQALATRPDFRGGFYVAGQAMIVAVVYIVSEVTLKKVDCPFSVQMAQTRFICFCATVVGCSGYFMKYGWGIFDGLNWRIIVLLIGLVTRDWCQTAIIKILSSMWKALSGGLAVCVTYITQCIFMGTPVCLLPLAFLLNTVLSVLGYAFASRRAGYPSTPPAPAAESQDAVAKKVDKS